MLIILFGLSGSGKNYVGDILQQEFGYYYWDADQAMPEEMRQAILNKEFFTQAMRDKLTMIMIEKTSELKKKYKTLVISQALYKEKNRTQLHLAYPDAKFMQVEATSANILDRLKKRNDDVDYSYAEKIRQNFEIPLLPHAIITNNSDKSAIITQLKKLI